MFLDDELFKMCKDADCTNYENIQQLNVDLKEKCQEYYKARINENMRDREVKTILDRTFNLWDSFVGMLLTSTDSKLSILGDLFKQHSFKRDFLSDEKLNQVYKSL